jgi:hypothetical protein
MASRMRERILGGILRRSFCAAVLSWTLKEAIFAQPPFHFIQADDFFVPTFRNDREVMEIFHEPEFTTFTLTGGLSSWRWDVRRG